MPVESARLSPWPAPLASAPSAPGTPHKHDRLRSAAENPKKIVRAKVNLNEPHPASWPLGSVARKPSRMAHSCVSCHACASRRPGCCLVAPPLTFAEAKPVGYAFGAHLNQNRPQVVAVGSDGRRPLSRRTIGVDRNSDMTVATEHNRLVYAGHASGCRDLRLPPRIAPRDLIDVGLGQRLSLPSRLGTSPRLSSIPLGFTSGHLRKKA